MSDLVIVSNRGPFSFTGDFLQEAEQCLAKGNSPEPPKFGAGGLVQAMTGLLKSDKWTTTWVGASMGDKDIEVTRGHYDQLFDRMFREGHAPNRFPHIEIDPENRMHFRYKDYDFYMRFVFFDSVHMQGYYGKFANGFLWPLMHLTRSPLFYKKAKAFPRPQFEDHDFVQYTSSGVTFANTIFDELQKRKDFWKDGSSIVVWGHDYHIMRIAEVYQALLREQEVPRETRERIRIGQFIHTPFFNIHEIQGLIREDKRSRVKAKRYNPFGDTIESVLQKLTWGILANDFVSFHTREYCDNYLEALEEWFPVDISIRGNFFEIAHQDGVTTVGAFPIGLDVDGILSEVGEGKKLLYRFGSDDLYTLMDRDRKGGRYIFGGLERCDYTKGLVERLHIFRHALDQLRASGEDARLYQVTAPSRSANPDYQYLQSVLAQEVAAVNRKLQEDAIVHLDQGIPSPQNYRFMKEVRIMLVTPLDDGMNLVAFEYILSQKYKRPKDRGLLVLSTSGASRVLRERGFGEEDGIVYVNPMQPKGAAEKTLAALKRGSRLSDRVIEYVTRERRVDDWADKNVEAILACRKRT
jgi:trehalose-6-phosphate synthase